jgi:hypothetical protein
MRISTFVRCEWDGAKYVPVESIGYEYSGAVAETKGEGTARDQLALQNKLAQQQLDLENQRLADVKAGVGKYLSGSEGYDPAQLATMKAQFLNQNALNYNQGSKNVMTALARRGSAVSGQPAGGDFTKGIASLQGAAASDRSAGLGQIDISNLQQALVNKFQAANLMSGNAATFAGNVGTFNSGANNALNQYVYASNQGFGNAFTTALGSSLGKGLGAGITGGLGTAASTVGSGQYGW